MQSVQAIVHKERSVQSILSQTRHACKHMRGRRDIAAATLQMRDPNSKALVLRVGMTDREHAGLFVLKIGADRPHVLDEHPTQLLPSAVALAVSCGQNVSQTGTASGMLDPINDALHELRLVDSQGLRTGLSEVRHSAAELEDTTALS